MALLEGYSLSCLTQPSISFRSPSSPTPYRMDRTNVITYIPQILKEWGIPELKERTVVRRAAIKGGRRSGIMKGVYTTDAGELRIVAIKIVNMEYASSKASDPARRMRLLVEYFKRECRIWAALGHHENVVPLLGFVPTLPNEVFPSLIMPYYEGGNLIRFVRQHNISPRGKVKLMRDVAAGLEHMHSLNPPAIHRDLKASNIIVELLGYNRYRARIADFGSTKLAEMESEILVTGGTSAPVTFSWTPPEYVKISDITKKPIIDFSDPTPAGDIWSFGCTFLEVFRGKNPWDGYQVEAELIKGNHPPHPEDCEIDGKCWAVMLICWFLSPERRPTATQLVEHLRKIEWRLE